MHKYVTIYFIWYGMNYKSKFVFLQSLLGNEIATLRAVAPEDLVSMALPDFQTPVCIQEAIIREAIIRQTRENCLSCWASDWEETAVQLLLRHRNRR